MVVFFIAIPQIALYVVVQGVIEFNAILDYDVTDIQKLTVTNKAMG